jgi:hypothetical protein
MDKVHFSDEITNLKKFFELYCHNKHTEQNSIDIGYGDDTIDTISLCRECHNIFDYTCDRLKECELEPKPKCRKCKSNCYNDKMYKEMAKVMSYSGMRLGLGKLKNKLLRKNNN